MVEDDSKHNKKGVESEEEAQHKSSIYERISHVSHDPKKQKVLAALLILVIVMVVYFAFLKPSDDESNKNMMAVKEAREVEDLDQEQQSVKPPTNNEIPILAPPPLPDMPDILPPPEKIREPEKVNTEPKLPSLGGVDTSGVPKKQPNLISPPTVGGVGGGNIPIPSGSTRSATARQSRSSPMIAFGGTNGSVGAGAGETNDYKDLKDSGTLTTDSSVDEDGAIERSDNQVMAEYIGDMQLIIAQGKLIDAILETGINTDLSGQLRAVVSRDVYAEAGTHVLIPKGSRLLGEYATTISYTQARVDVTWSRILLPNGLDFQLESYATDQLGRAGVSGMMDNKLLGIMANAFLISSIKITSGVILDKLLGDSQNIRIDDNSGTGVTTTTGSAAAQLSTEAVRDFTDVLTTFVKRYEDSQPTLMVNQGARVKVFVAKDLVFPRYAYSKHTK